MYKLLAHLEHAKVVHRFTHNCATTQLMNILDHSYAQMLVIHHPTLVQSSTVDIAMLCSRHDKRKYWKKVISSNWLLRWVGAARSCLSAVCALHFLLDRCSNTYCSHRGEDTQPLLIPSRSLSRSCNEQLVSESNCSTACTAATPNPNQLDAAQRDSAMRQCSETGQ